MQEIHRESFAANMKPRKKNELKTDVVFCCYSVSALWIDMDGKTRQLPQLLLALLPAISMFFRMWESDDILKTPQMKLR